MTRGNRLGPEGVATVLRLAGGLQALRSLNLTCAPPPAPFPPRVACSASRAPAAPVLVRPRRPSVPLGFRAVVSPAVPSRCTLILRFWCPLPALFPLFCVSSPTLCLHISLRCCALHLFSCRIGRRCASEGGNPALRRSYNQLGVSGGAAVASALDLLPALKELNLGCACSRWCNLPDLHCQMSGWCLAPLFSHFPLRGL